LVHFHIQKSFDYWWCRSGQINRENNTINSKIQFQAERVMSDFALEALSRLQDWGNFHWYVIPLLAVVFNFYIARLNSETGILL